MAKRPTASKSRPKMTDGALKALVEAELKQSVGYMGSQVVSDRTLAMDYYKGEPFGDEVDGQSKVVSRDVLDTIEEILPSLLEIFTAGDETVKFSPTGQEDEAGAEQATDYCNYVFNQDNNGFLILYTKFKDALLQKNGVVKIWWEEDEKEEAKPFAGLTPDAFALQAVEMQAKGYALEDLDADEAGLRSGTWTQTKKVGRVCVENVPPEEFYIARRAKMINGGGRGYRGAPFVAHRDRVPASQLIEDGFDKDIVDALPAEDTDINEEKEKRSREIDSADYDSTINHEMRLIVRTEAYLFVDWDGDGKAEPRKVMIAGDKVLSNEAWDGPWPFASITPIIMPHRWTGISVAELVMDIQKIKSTLWRQVLNNLYLTNFPRTVVNPDVTTVDDLLTYRIGGVVRTSGDPSTSVYPITVPNSAAASMPMLEYCDTVAERRTGSSHLQPGPDANALSNQSATAANILASQTQARIKLIARIFAETGVKDIFSIILWLLRRYPDQAKRTIRLRKKWVEMDPGSWSGDYDLNVAVGLGTGSRDQMLQHLMSMAGIQEKIIMLQGGPTGPLVWPEHIHNTAVEIAKNMGFKEPDQFVADPKAPPDPNNPRPQAQPKPDPKMIEAQGKLEIEKQRAQFDQQHQQAVAQADAQHEATKAAAEHQRIMDKMQADNAVAIRKAELDTNLALEVERIKAATAIEVALINANAKASAETAANAAAPAKSNGAGDSPKIIIGANGEAAKINDSAGQIANSMATLMEGISRLTDMHGQSLAAQQQPKAPRTMRGRLGPRAPDGSRDVVVEQ